MNFTYYLSPTKVSDILKILTYSFSVLNSKQMSRMHIYDQTINISGDLFSTARVRQLIVALALGVL